MDENTPQIVTSVKRSFATVPIIVGTVLIILLLSIIVALIVLNPDILNKTSSQSKTNNNTEALVRGSPIFSSQSANTEAAITNIKNGQLTLQTKHGIQDSFPISSKLKIYKYQLEGQPASPSSELNKIELNRPAVIYLEVINGVYQIVSVSYLPNIP